MINEIIVSVICVTYNHEPYIRDSIISVLKQEINFNIEILVGEDCSTDGSAAVLKDLQLMYPERIVVYYRKKNMGAIKNIQDLFLKAKGKYIIVLETDDFWIDSKKLEKQVMFLEKHKEYLAVGHRCIMVDDNNKPLGIRFPECNGKQYDLSDFRKGKFPGQTTTLLFRNYYRYNLGFPIALVKKDCYLRGPGDLRRAFVLASNGKIAMLDDTMSIYRYINHTGSSFTATQSKNPYHHLKYRYCFVDYAKKYVKTSESIWSAEYLLFRDMLIYFLKYKNPEIKALTTKTLNNLQYPVKTVFFSMVYVMACLIRKILGISETYKKSNIVEENKILAEARKNGEC